MGVCTADFELGVSGAQLTAGDPGSATPYDNVSSAPNFGGQHLLYSNALAAHGSQCMSYLNTAGFYNNWYWATPFGTQTGTWYARFYLQFQTGYPPSNLPLFSTNTGGAGPQMNAGPAGAGYKLTFYTDSSQTNSITTANVYPLNQWVRVECKFVQGAGTSGAIAMMIFSSADSITPDETVTLSSVNTGASNVWWVVGDYIGVNPNRWFMDQLVAAATAYPGPFPVSTTAPTITGSTPVGSVLTAGNGVWNSGGTFTYTYQWTRDGVNIGGATSSTYVTQPADVGHAIGCTVTATGLQATNEVAAQASSNTITPTSAANGGFLSFL